MTMSDEVTTEQHANRLDVGASIVATAGMKSLAKDMGLAAARLRELSKAQAWNTDMKTAPRDGTPVLLAVERRDGMKRIRFAGEAFYHKHIHHKNCWWWANTDWDDDDKNPLDDNCKILGWQAMPVPPAAEKQS